MEQMACTQFVRRIGQQMDLIRELRIKLMEKEKGSGLLLKELQEARETSRILKMKLEAVGEEEPAQLKKKGKQSEAPGQILGSSSLDVEVGRKNEIERLLNDHQESIKAKDALISGLSEELKALRGQSSANLERLSRANERLASQEKMEFGSSGLGLQRGKTPESTGYESRFGSNGREGTARGCEAVLETG